MKILNIYYSRDIIQDQQKNQNLHFWFYISNLYNKYQMDFPIIIKSGDHFISWHYWQGYWQLVSVSMEHAMIQVLIVMTLRSAILHYDRVHNGHLNEVKQWFQQLRPLQHSLFFGPQKMTMNLKFCLTKILLTDIQHVQ